MNNKLKDENQEEGEEDINFFVASIGDSPKGLSTLGEKGKSIASLVESLQNVDLESSDSEANKTSISDNNGGRIELEEDLTSPDIIKK